MSHGLLVLLKPRNKFFNWRRVRDTVRSIPLSQCSSNLPFTSELWCVLIVMKWNVDGAHSLPSNTLLVYCHRKLSLGGTALLPGPFRTVTIRKQHSLLWNSGPIIPSSFYLPPHLSLLLRDSHLESSVAVEEASTPHPPTRVLGTELWEISKCSQPLSPFSSSMYYGFTSKIS